MARTETNIPRNTLARERATSFSQQVSWAAWVIINNYRTLNPPSLSLCPGQDSVITPCVWNSPSPGCWGALGLQGEEEEEDADRLRGQLLTLLLPCFSSELGCEPPFLPPMNPAALLATE